MPHLKPTYSNTTAPFMLHSKLHSLNSWHDWFTCWKKLLPGLSASSPVSIFSVFSLCRASLPGTLHLFHIPLTNHFQMFSKHMVRYSDRNDSSYLVPKAVSVASSFLRQTIEHLQFKGRQVYYFSWIQLQVSWLWASKVARKDLTEESCSTKASRKQRNKEIARYKDTAFQVKSPASPHLLTALNPPTNDHKVLWYNHLPNTWVWGTHSRDCGKNWVKRKIFWALTGSQNHVKPSML